MAILSAIILSVIILSVVILNVVAPSIDFQLLLTDDQKKITRMGQCQKLFQLFLPPSNKLERLWRHKTQHDNPQHDNPQHDDTQRNDTQHIVTQHNDTQHNKKYDN